ncbi:MAG: acetamidase/formamidase family protein [Coriobacteriia bacterium]|nr:acetamidase/formamidase family protein [Coriobacteriia bacterium]
MSTLSNEHVFYAFDPSLEPALRIAQGEELTLETMDCFANQLNSPGDEVDALDWDRINPATGPVFIEGVKAGDLVRVRLLKVEPTGHSTMTCIPGEGALADHIEASETTIIENCGDAVVLPTQRGLLTIAAKPMIGVIGLAPAEGSVPNGTPGVHGGNMDCTVIGQGAALYFKAGVDGGLFGCGDLHAVMGDGEVLVCGAETPGLVTITAEVIDEPQLPVPLVETDDLYAVVASAGSIDDATKLAIDLMFSFLTKVAKLSVNDAGRLMSLVGNLKFCQVVDPQVTVRFEFPKSVLQQLGYPGIG